MLIGKAGDAKSAICTADETSITIRGRDLCNELMGKVSFTHFFLLHLTGQEPTEDQVFFLDTVLVSLAEHGLTPSAVAARMTYAAAPEAFQGAVAAGILGCGSVILGSAELGAKFLAEGVRRAGESGRGDLEVATEMVRELRAEKRTVPGFGHPIHRPVDPRAVRMLELADERGISGRHVAFLRATQEAADTVFGKHLVMNVNGTIPAVALDIDFPMSAMRGLSILSRTAGLIGHLAEEAERPIGFLMASHAMKSINYDGG
ncbi:MAG TPA: citryl-CoA lyase [Alphaproteobacteria bacterium]|nr:citryl-CoA lyase [Alphaproteobacteria bacterium]